MTRVLPRTNFHSSKLLRCLIELGIADAVEPENAFAEKLGQWTHFTDAIALAAVHGDSMASQPKTQSGMRPEARSAARGAAGIEFDRIQTMLANSIKQSCSPNSGRAHIRLPAPDPEPPMNPGTAYAPYRRFYEAHQRDMELSIQPLRVNLREALAKVSPKLRTLAELDATLDKILRERESKLLAKVPVLLKKRFEQLFNEQQPQPGNTPQEDKPAVKARAEAWLTRFCHDMQMLLLAELELRLQPATGLMEAFKQDTQ